MNEADTGVRLIEPKLKATGWTDQQVTREFYYNRDYQYTKPKLSGWSNQFWTGLLKVSCSILRYRVARKDLEWFIKENCKVSKGRQFDEC